MVSENHMTGTCHIRASNDTSIISMIELRFDLLC